MSNKKIKPQPYRRILIKVITRAKKERVEENHQEMKVYLTVPPIKNQANKRLIEVLADYFQVSKGKIKIVKGEKSKHKIIEIN